MKWPKNDEYLRNSKNLSGLREETPGGLGKMRILALRLQHLTADNQGKLPRKLPNWKQGQYVCMYIYIYIYLFIYLFMHLFIYIYIYIYAFKRHNIDVYFRNLKQGSDQ